MASQTTTHETRSAKGSLEDGAFPVLLDPAEHGRTMFLGVPLKMGSGGSLVPKKERFKDDVITDFDVKLMRDVAIALDLNLPVLIEGGADLGKTQGVDRICAAVNREVYFVNCRDIEAEMLIGRMTAVEGTKSGFGWKDGIAVQAIRNGGVLVLDEYNKLKGEARAAFHQVYDAILRDKREIVLAENNGEVVPLHDDFRLVLTQNPPDGDYSNREVIDPAEFSRVISLKYPAQLPKEIEEARLLGSFGLKAETTYKEPEALPFQEPLSKEALATIPGLQEILVKFGEFHRHIREAITNRQLGADNAQPVYMTFQRDVKRVFTFVSHYYDGDITKTFGRALEYYFVNRFETDLDRQKVREAARLVEYTPIKGNTTRIPVADPAAPPVAAAGASPALDSIKTILGKNYIGPEAYKEIFGARDVGTVPAIPASVTSALLNEKCKLTNDGRTVAQTHRLVFIPSKLDGKDVTVNSIRKLATDVQGSRGRDTMFYDQDWYDSQSFANTPLVQGKWILMPTVDIPNTRSKNYDAQEKELKKFPDYHTATALEMVVGLTMNDLHVKPDRSAAGAYYNNYGWCSDALTGDLSGRRVCVGDFYESGLDVGYDSVGGRNPDLGRAGLRNI